MAQKNIFWTVEQSVSTQNMEKWKKTCGEGFSSFLNVKGSKTHPSFTSIHSRKKTRAELVGSNTKKLKVKIEKGEQNKHKHLSWLDINIHMLIFDLPIF